MSKIYIVSLSPSIDYIVNLSHFTLNATNRPSSTDMYAAGKGTHVSMFMQNFNIDNELILFLNGYHEKYYLDQMKNLKIKTKVFHSNSDVRINLKLIDNTTQTECSVNAPEIENSEFQKMLNYLKRNVKPNDIVVTTGSIPKNMGVDTYEQIAMVVSQNKGLNVVDAFGPVLLNAIKQPF
jgi:1-phosphofructokinase